MSDAVNLFLYLNDWLKMVPRREVYINMTGSWPFLEGIFTTYYLQSGNNDEGCRIVNSEIDPRHLQLFL